ncbi:hypothetical protein CDL15_Pgr018415 [Punica granatum]|nr:hypothetical protein CDL15_Pgr018415 [Punica granatum]
MLWKSRSKSAKKKCLHGMPRTSIDCYSQVSVSAQKGLGFDFLNRSLSLRCINPTKLGKRKSVHLLGLKKLQLVLDLDHTLLHSIQCSRLTASDRCLKNLAVRECDPKCGDLFIDVKGEWITKLRPFVRSFLKEASALFEMTVFTRAQKPYAERMVKLLDPDGCYFKSRVMVREDCIGEGYKYKSLTKVPGMESNILILDDKENVWANHSRNLIQMEPYHYFACGSLKYNMLNASMDAPALANPIKMDESEDDGPLAMTLALLREIHSRYFDSDPRVGGMDVRTLLREL